MWLQRSRGHIRCQLPQRHLSPGSVVCSKLLVIGTDCGDLPQMLEQNGHMSAAIRFLSLAIDHLSGAPTVPSPVGRFPSNFAD